MFHRITKNEIEYNFTDSNPYDYIQNDPGRPRTAHQYFEAVYNIKIQKDFNSSLYKKLNDIHEVEEHLGTYYQEDKIEEGTDPTLATPVDESVPESNKTKKRVITYIAN